MPYEKSSWVIYILDKGSAKKKECYIASKFLKKYYMCITCEEGQQTSAPKIKNYEPTFIDISSHSFAPFLQQIGINFGPNASLPICHVQNILRLKKMCYAEDQNSLSPLLHS